MEGKKISALSWYCKKAILTLRYDGFNILFWQILRVCLRPLADLGYAALYRIDLTQPINEVPVGVNMSITQAVEADIDQLAKLVALRYERSGPVTNLDRYTRLGIHDTIAQRFQRGCKCFVRKIGTDIVGYNWIFFNWEESIYRSGCFIHLKEDEALMDEAFTLEGWRGKGIHVALHIQMLLFLKRAGYRRAYTISGSPQSPMKVFDCLPWERYGVMLYFIPRGSEKAWVRRIRGRLEPFVYEQIPAGGAEGSLQ